MDTPFSLVLGAFWLGVAFGIVVGLFLAPRHK